jgi:hypothetical protein
MSLCQYKNILGEPGKGIHAARDPIFNTAINDVVMTILGAYLISKAFNYTFYFVLIILFLLGIFLHRIFCVETTIDKFLFS